MGAKKPTAKPRSIRYMLSADRRLQKISLRKIQERMAKTKEPQARSPQPKHALLATPPVPPAPRAYSWRAIVVGATCLLAAVALMTARQSADEGDATAGPPSIAAASVKAAMTVPPEPKKPAVSKPAAPAAAKPVATTLTTPAETVTAAPANGDVAAAAPEAAGPANAPVTITGCLERDGDAYWLKDTSGADVPKARSWKTGFLKKRAARIELIDTSAALRLSTHVGERVAATGTLMNREMRARSLRRVAAGCN